MNISVAEISSIIKQHVTVYDKTVDVSETGTVLTTGDGIARLHGLENAMAGELLEFPNDVVGMVLNLEEEDILLRECYLQKMRKMQYGLHFFSILCIML